jgi:hypothetical protein
MWRQRISRIKSWQSIPAILLVFQGINGFVGFLSNLDWISNVKNSITMKYIMEVFTSPFGNWLTLTLGIAWLAYLILRTEKQQTMLEKDILYFSPPQQLSGTPSLSLWHIGVLLKPNSLLKSIEGFRNRRSVRVSQNEMAIR